MAKLSLLVLALAAITCLAAANTVRVAPQKTAAARLVASRLAARQAAARQAAARLAAAKGKGKRVLPVKKQRPIPLSLNCQIAPGAPGQKIVNCKVTNLLKIPVCAHLRCSPGPSGICATGQGGGGAVQTSGPPPDCSWNVVNGCSSPGVVFPGGQWSFGYMTSWQGPISVTFPPWNMALSPAVNGTLCTT